MAALTISDLKKTYANGVSALNGINLQVEEGDFFALLGPNGAGKSTTIGIISSLINKTSGNVNVFGYDIQEQASIAKSCIGLVPQDFNFNIFENAYQILLNQAGYYGMSSVLAKDKIHHYLNKLGLWDKRDQISRNLSGGMKRRLMIARALIHEPKLLILDEPTAGVDIEIRRATWDFLKEINQQGTTIILTTHYLEEAETLCKNIAIIDKGYIVENTTMKSLLKKLQIETFILYLKTPITELPFIEGYPITMLDETTLEISINQNQNLNYLFSKLTEQSIMITSMRNKSNRLEELFLRLVGHAYN
ncbi:MAG: putative ABC transporter ATP-binding protein YadG [Legionellaceae bacterium]